MDLSENLCRRRLMLFIEEAKYEMHPKRWFPHMKNT